MFSIKIENRYAEWKMSPIQIQLSPLESKLFHLDEFNYIDNQLTITRSAFREIQHIPGILILEKNCSFGRTNNKKRLYYKCIPYDSHLPIFLIPYEINMGFNKNFRNKYVTFHFDSWEDKHPHGILSQTIGDVDDLPSFYEYQLFCKKLHHSMTKIIQKVKKDFKAKSRTEWMNEIMNQPDKYGNIECLSSETKIFAIDPTHCTDRDDALSIRPISDTEYRICVYISNVWVWLEALSLWNCLSERVSTIYLPDKKRNMLPSQISEECCSLDEGKSSFAFMMEFVVSSSKNAILSFESPRQVQIVIHKNYSYDDESLQRSKYYQMLEKTTKGIDPSISDSHDVVAFWMTKMNTHMAYLMRQNKIGIFRTTTQHNSPSSTMNSFVRQWEQHISGQYVIFHPYHDLSHEVMKVKEYVHFTSPIRRMVDLVNQFLWVSSNEHPNLSTESQRFCENLQIHLDLVNSQMKSIKKVESNCDILCRVTETPSFLESTFEGLILSKDKTKYQVYVKELKWITNAYCLDTLDIYSSVSCKIYIFQKEDQFRKKVRLQIV